MSLGLFLPTDCSDAEAAGHSSPSIKHCDMGHVIPGAANTWLRAGADLEHRGS